MKIDRLIAIINYLLRHGKTSAGKLSEEFEVSARTIVRDMETLEQAGIPIQSIYGADGGYSIMDTYVVDRKMINPKDYDYIITALWALLSAYANKDVEQTMDKMMPFYDNRQQMIKLDFSVANENREISAYINILERAIRQQKAVRFRYTNNENVEKQIEAEPVRLEFKWYNWYLIAFYPKHQDYYMFKLVRMEKIEVLEKEITVNHENQDIAIQDERKTITVTLRGNAMIKSKCKEYLNGKVTEEYENGDFEFRFCVPESEVYWYGVILSFGNNVTILEPQSVIDRILATCDEVKKIYVE
ncbi:MAG: WYL domain-containing protein [Lachnospiraceae bacterium]|nr:WYL domain-containing protein [Lachnospiraceae bacterium]